MTNARQVTNSKHQFLTLLLRKLGEQKIDIVIKFSDFELPIYAIAKETGIKLHVNKNIEILQLEQNIKIADIHEKRIKEALEYVKQRFPLESEDVEDLSLEEIAMMELFTTRFAKLQDILGRKIFPLLFQILTKESAESRSMIDILNKFEKLEIIPDAAFWESFRGARNNLAHEYPDDPSAMASELNICHEKSLELTAFYENLKKIIDTRVFQASSK